MTETVVHVTTLEQWKSVLDVWFNQGFDWYNVGDGYMEERFNNGSRQLGLNVNGEYEISYWSRNGYEGEELIEYSEFMAQQKEDKEVKTYYVTQEQLNLIDELKSKTFPIDFLILNSDGYFKPLTVKLTSEEAKALLRYLGGDKTIEFKVKEQLYRLSRLDKYGDTVYFTKKWGIGNPVVSSKNYAFTAPLDEIKKWQTPAWEIEEVK